jgi:hypothetical protein
MKPIVLIIAACFSLVSAAEDALQKALQNGTLEGSLYLLYYDQKSDRDTETYTSAAAGGSLEYTTAKTPGIYLRAKLGTTNPTGKAVHPERARLGDENGESVDVLGVAHLGFIDGNHLLTIGRQELDTPLLNGDTTRVLPYSYRGVGYMWSGPEKSRVVLGHMEEVRPFDSRRFEPVSDSGVLESGVWYAGAESLPSEGLGFQAYYYQADGLYDALFFQLDESVEWKGMRLFAGTQYVKSYRNGGENIDPLREEGGDDIALAALRLGFKRDTVGLIVAHSQNSGQDGLGRAYGGQAKLFTTTLDSEGIHRGSPKTTSVRLKYDWTPETSSRLVYNTTAYAVEAHDKLPDSMTDDYTVLYADLQHAVPGDALVYFQYEQLARSVSKTTQETFRFSFVQWF